MDNLLEIARAHCLGYYDSSDEECTKHCKVQAQCRLEQYNLLRQISEQIEERNKPTTKTVFTSETLASSHEYMYKANSLQGLMFCLTGTLTQTRSEVEGLIARYGGINSTKVTSAVSYLIVGDRGKDTNKYLEAGRRNVMRISEAQFVQLLKGQEI